MTKEQKFYKALQNVFIGAKIEGEGGFVNLMRIKSNYYRKIEDILKKDIEAALKSHPKFRDELFDKLYSFFSRYFTESGSIYFNSTPFHNDIYEKVYTDEKDVILFWKTQMLYYVKTDKIFRSLPVEFDGFKFYFDASKIESKKANEKRSLVFELSEVREDSTIVFGVQYSERGKKTKQDELLKAIKKKGLSIAKEQLERAFRVFEKQSEVDFFINKNAKAFLQEQFKLWSYQYFWEGAKEWDADRVNQLQILKDIAFKIIDFISQFEDELVKIWNKPKFVKNSNYVITLDRIADKNVELVEKVLNHSNLGEQIKEWQELGIVDKNFKAKDVFENSPFVKGWQSEGLTGYLKLPYNSKLKDRARELRKAGNLSEVLLWNELKQKKILGYDFTRQQIIGNYIVDFHCPKLNLVIEIDGESHNYKGEYDVERDKFLQSLGLIVLHFNDLDIKRSLGNVLESIKSSIERNTPSANADTPLKKGNTPSANADTPLQEGKNTPSASQTPLLIKGEFRHLPIDTKYFKDFELEILNQFDDLDKSLDGWLIKSENYQALNTILPKFKEQVQTIYIDPPFNTGEDFDYVDRFQDSTWLSLMENRLELSKYFLNSYGSYFINLDENADFFGRILLEKLNLEEVKKITFNTNATKDEEADLFGYKSFGKNFALKSSTIYFCKNKGSKFFKLWKPNRNTTNLNIGWLDLIALPKKDRNKFNKIEDFDYFVEKNENGNLKYQKVNIDEKIYPVSDIWSDIYSFTQSEMRISENLSFATQKPENFLRRVIQSSLGKNDIILDFFGGSGTTFAVAQKLKRKWLGVEMSKCFHEFYEGWGNTQSKFIKKLGILGRLKNVLAGDKNFKAGDKERRSHLTKDLNWQGGGFFKYYELEQYEEALANCKYKDGDLFNAPGKSPYQEYVFMKDEKMLKALEIDYKNEKVKVDLNKLYSNTPSADADTPLKKGKNTPSADADTPLKKGNIDIAETLSNLTGKWIKKISKDEVEFEDGTKINLKDLDYKLIKPLIWWE